MDAASRLAVYRQFSAAAQSVGATFSHYMQPDIERARYRLGTSVADRMVPYVIDEGIQEMFSQAALELAYLYVQRNRHFLGDEIYEPVMLKMSLPQSALQPPEYGVPPTGGVMGRAMARGAEILSGLDGGVLASWWAAGRHGYQLINTWAKMLAQGYQEMDRSESSEETPYFLHWSLVEAYPYCIDAVRQIELPPEPEQEVMVAVMVGLHLAHHVVRDHLRETRRSAALAGARIDLAWDVALCPRLTFRAVEPLLDYCHFYPVPASILGARLEPIVARIEQVGIEAAARDVEAAFGDPRLSGAAWRQLFLAQARGILLDVLSGQPQPGGDVWALCHALLRHPEKIEYELSSPARRKKMLEQIDAARKTRTGGAAGGRLSELHQMVASYQPGGVALEPGSSSHRFAVESVLADTGDRMVAAAGEFALRRFQRRTGGETDRSLEHEYETGRLYCFGPRISPYLREYERAASMAHYFIDLKDYTRRTSLLKEDVMADFIRTEFYEPIIAIAEENYHGMSDLADRGGVHLNNLLGDAVSLSGDIVSLVEIQRRIRKHLDKYARMLEQRVGEGDLARQAEAVRVRYAKELEATLTRKTNLERAHHNLERMRSRTTAQDENLKGLRNNIVKLETELKRLAQAEEDEVANLTGQHLLSGSFITFGASPTVVTFDSGVWGHIEVAIAERINESARGTARKATVLAALQAMLDYEAQESARRRRRELPFLVYVANSPGLPLTPRYELELRDAFRERDGSRIYAAYARAAREHVNRTLSGGPDAVEDYLQEGMALYNSGDAVSGEGMLAYCKARAKLVSYVQSTVATDQLAPAFRARFAVFEPFLRLVIGFDANSRVAEVFRYAGQVYFKGFEADAPTEVWELVDLDTEAGQLLAADPQILQARSQSTHRVG